MEGRGGGDKRRSGKGGREKEGRKNGEADSGGIGGKDVGRVEEGRIEGDREVGERDKRGDRREKTGEKDWKMAFWNIAGLKGKDKEFYKRLERWDVMMLMETWVREKGWQRIEERLPGGYVWKRQGTKRRNRKGRSMERMVIGVRKEFLEGEKKVRGGEGIIEG